MYEYAGPLALPAAYCVLPVLIPRVSRRHEMPSRTLPSTALYGFLSVSTAFCAFLFHASRTTRHPTSLPFSYFDRQMLVSGLFRPRRAFHGRKSPPGRNRENDVLTDVSPYPCTHNVVWHTTPSSVETLVHVGGGVGGCGMRCGTFWGGRGELLRGPDDPERLDTHCGRAGLHTDIQVGARGRVPCGTHDHAPLEGQS